MAKSVEGHTLAAPQRGEDMLNALRYKFALFGLAAVFLALNAKIAAEVSVVVLVTAQDLQLLERMQERLLEAESSAPRKSAGPQTRPQPAPNADDPKILIESPADSARVDETFELNVRFDAGGAAIDAASVRLFYAGRLDITAKVRPYITPEGLRLSGASLPRGNHILTVSLTDVKGRTSNSSVRFSVK